MNFNPEELIRAQISLNGKITFDEFMDIALYSDRGYYRELDHIGTEGDYYTSPRIHPIFGALVCAQIMQMWKALQKPDRFTIVEQGAGDSVFAEDILNVAEQIDQRFYQALDYVLYDIRNVSTVNSKIRTVESKSIDLRGITGVVISNELLDAFPVKQIQVVDDRVFELYVTTDSNGQLIEELDEPSDKVLKEFFSLEELKSLSGYRGPVNMHLKGWAENMSEVIKDGFLVTIDYGYERDKYYSTEKSKKLLQTFYMHTNGGSPFQRIGKQDITAHVDFTALELACVSGGFNTVYKGKQFEWLNRLGFDALSRVIQDRREMRLANQLVLEDSLGAFNVLIQRKGLTNLGEDFTGLSNIWQNDQIRLEATKNHMAGARQHNIA